MDNIQSDSASHDSHTSASHDSNANVKFYLVNFLGDNSQLFFFINLYLFLCIFFFSSAILEE